MKNLILTTALLSLVGCQSSNNKSWDLGNQWDFTTGIEAAAHDANGNLYAVNFGKTDGTVGTFKAESASAELYFTLPEGSIGNGIVFDKNNTMYIADYTKHNIWKYQNDSLSVLSHSESMNQPNDLAITPSNEFIFASDPNWKEGTGQLWRANTVSGELTLMEKNMGTTNGVEVSPNGQKLYVGESKQLNIWSYDLDPKTGELSNKQLFYKFEGYGMDGMRCDVEGNLYVCRYDKGNIVKISPQGELLKEWELTGKQCSNITLVEDKAYITMQDRGCMEVIAL